MQCIDDIQASSNPTETFKNAIGKMSGSARAVGSIVGVGDVDGVFFSLDSKYSKLASLMEMGLLRGLSLTHAEDENGKKVPVELTLTNDPLRTSAYVSERYLPSQFQRQTYKPRRMEVETNSATEQSPLEVAMSKMDDSTKELFTARFSELMGRIQELEKAPATPENEAHRQEFETKLNEAQTKLEETVAKLQAVEKENLSLTQRSEQLKAEKEAQEGMGQIFLDQVEQLMECIVPEDSKLSQSENSIIKKGLEQGTMEGNAAAFRQLVTACSRRIGSRLAARSQISSVSHTPKPEEPEFKRSRVQKEPQEFDLQRALQANFH